MTPAPTPAPVPTDAVTVGEIIATMETAGFDAQMAARPGAMILCLACHVETPASDVTLEALGRTEGASDPADMLAVAGAHLPGLRRPGHGGAGLRP